MPRTPRPDFTNTYHHVVVRGVDKLPIFDSEEKKRSYLDILKDVHSAHDISIYAFGFLSTHVHQFVRRNQQSLGRFYRRVNGRYAQWYNYRFERSGGLYEGRYHSTLVQSDAYCLSVFQYVHNQGVEAGLYEKPEADPWNTAKVYQGETGCFGWIDWQEAVSELIDVSKVDKEVTTKQSNEVEDWFEEGLPAVHTRNQTFLADEDFIEKYMQIRKSEVRETDRKESPVAWETLLELAVSESGFSRSELVEPDKSPEKSEWRSGLAYAGRRYGHMSLSELAGKLNVSPSGVSRMVKRVKERDGKIKRWWDDHFSDS